MFTTVDPDEDWQAMVAVANELKEPAEHESLDDLIPSVDTKVIVRPGGALFVSSWAVHAALNQFTGTFDYDDGQLIRVGKQTFEILAYLEDDRLYWVRSFPTEVSDEDLAALCGG